MQQGRVFPVSSLDGTHFTGALVQNAALAEDLTLGGALGAGGVTAARIKSLTILSSDNLAWEIQIFGSHDGPNADVNKDTFLGRWTFATGDAVQIAGAGTWYYYIDGLDIPFGDQDLGQHVGAAINVPQAHVRLLNRSAGAKTAYGVGGHFRLTLNLEPTQGGA